MSSEQEKTPLRTQIATFCEDNWPDEDILLFGLDHGDPYDKGFLGVGYQHTRGPLAIYDREKCFEALAMEFSVDTIYVDGGDADAALGVLLARFPLRRDAGFLLVARHAVIRDGGNRASVVRMACSHA